MATSSPRNIVLAGFMGTGKTTVGRRVAALLGWPFVDADEEIVRRAGRSIPDIFARDGETAFRQIERDVCRELAVRERAVIATGGGMLVDDANRAAMEATGLVVRLRARPETLAARLAGDSGRPLLKTDWRALLAAREPAYARIAQQVETDGRAPEDVAAEIVERWRNLNASP